ncbi:MAG: ABC transporter permease [Chloroflexi bacterium]|nr:ABC transporter permease [Chloroflexota bacterium]
MAVGKSLSATGTTRRVAARSRPWLYTSVGVWAVRLATLAGLLAVWQWYASGLNRALLAPPSEIAVAFYQQAFVQGTIWGAIADSLITLFGGFALSMAIGVPMGIMMGRVRAIEHVADPYVSFLYALPHVSVVPLLVIWLGFELKFRLAYVVVSAVFPAIINTMTGVKNVSPELLDTGHAFCASERQKLWTIVLPSSLPYIFAGARQAFSSAWVGVVVAEMTATLTGVGGKILNYANQFRTADMLVSILIIMCVAVAIQGLSSYLQARLAPWQQPEQA